MSTFLEGQIDEALANVSTAASLVESALFIRVTIKCSAPAGRITPRIKSKEMQTRCIQSMRRWIWQMSNRTISNNDIKVQNDDNQNGSGHWQMSKVGVQMDEAQALILLEQTHQRNCTVYPLHPTPCTPHPTPYTLHSAPYTLHPSPCTLHPALFTLYPAPYLLHPKPYTLHPTPLPASERIASNLKDFQDSDLKAKARFSLVFAIFSR